MTGPLAIDEKLRGMAANSVGRSTREASLSDQLRRFKTHTPPPQGSKAQARLGESLRSRCAAVLLEHFAEVDFSAGEPSQARLASITGKLPVDLDPTLTCQRVNDESYWKRASLSRFPREKCLLQLHGMRWKQVFFELLLQEQLEDCDGLEDSVAQLQELVQAAREEIFSVRFEQLPSHIALYPILSAASNLTRLEISYGVKDIGMRYDRALFGMKISDATSLAKFFESSRSLTSVVLSQNILDDDLLRLLMVGLQKSQSITHIDLSNNRITDFGAQLISRLLSEDSIVVSVDLSNNAIQREGARHLAREIRSNESLLKLNLRLNHLADDGCRDLVDAVADNDTLSELSIGSNGASDASATAIAALMRRTKCALRVLNASNNHFSAEHISSFASAMKQNKSLAHLDLRQNPGCAEGTRQSYCFCCCCLGLIFA